MLGVKLSYGTALSQKIVARRITNGKLKFALKSILAHKMRSLLTMLGIIIGVSAVVVIVAMGSGMSESLTNL